MTADPITRTEPEQAAVLAHDDTPVAMGGLFHDLVGMWDVFDDIKGSFTTGDGIELDTYPAPWWDGMERFTNAAFETQLIQEWIPKADGVDDRVEFRLHDAADGLDGTFDLVTAFDVTHDLVDVDGVFASIHDALDPDGSWLLVDFDVADDLTENINPIATILSGFSLVYCLPTSLAGDGDGLGTCGLPPSEVQARASKAGFHEVRSIPIDDPFNLLYQLEP